MANAFAAKIPLLRVNWDIADMRDPRPGDLSS
jgi:hypothetical protein